MPESGVPLTPNTKLLSQDEIIKIAEIFAAEGVKKVKYQNIKIRLYHKIFLRFD